MTPDEQIAEIHGHVTEMRGEVAELKRAVDLVNGRLDVVNERLDAIPTLAQLREEILKLKTGPTPKASSVAPL